MIKKLLNNWQDKLFTVGGVFFTISLIPVLLTPTAVIPLLSSIPTSLFLYLFAYAQKTLGLKWAAGTSTITATMWALIAVLRH